MEAAKRDGRWKAAYAPRCTIAMPEDLPAALRDDPRAQRAFNLLDRRSRYAILYRLHDAKRAETRPRRLAKFVRMLDAGEPIHDKIARGPA